MVSKTKEQEHCCVHSNKRISWTAIIVGALTALGLGFLLNLFGVACILQTMSNGSVILAIGGMIGILAGIVFTTLIAGYVAGYLGRLYCPEQNLGVIYGFTTWVSALILGAAIMTIFSQYIMAYTGAVSHTDVVVPLNQITTPAGSISSTMGEKAVVAINVTQSNLAIGAFILFAMFFVGALFTCIGASWGMHCKRDDD